MLLRNELLVNAGIPENLAISAWTRSGHAPIIFPAVLQRPMRFRAIFYGHLVMLHVSLVVRVAGDLVPWPELRVWGGVANAAAILWFLGNTVKAILAARHDRATG